MWMVHVENPGWVVVNYIILSEISFLNRGVSKPVRICVDSYYLLFEINEMKICLSN